jgi:hypothetical protein
MIPQNRLNNIFILGKIQWKGLVVFNGFNDTYTYKHWVVWCNSGN